VFIDRLKNRLARKGRGEMTKPKPPEDLTFEQAFSELETLVTKLEEGDLPLEEALSTFERGQALAARCADLLDHAELKLKELVPDGSSGFRGETFEDSGS
jgi:exodeoxyribonuclease VII small subunit